MTDLGLLLAGMMDDLKGCLGAELDRIDAKPCHLLLVPGQQAIADYCGCSTDGCGQAWVRLDRAFPTTGTGVSQDGKAATCAAVVSATLEVGVFRCIPTSHGDGSPPTPVQLANAALQAARDAMAMHAAIACCASITSRPYVLGAYSPRDSGDCGGGVWPVTVQIVRRASRT